MVKLVPSVLPCTDSVWLRLSQWAGSLRTTSSTRVAVPRSACTHWGRSGPALCQYVPWLPSVMREAPYSECALLDDAVSPSAMSGPPAARAVVNGPPSASRLVAIAALRHRDLQVGVLISPHFSVAYWGGTPQAAYGPADGRACPCGGPARRQGRRTGCSGISCG